MSQPSLVIRNGTIIDGSGRDGYEADLAIADGRISAIGQNLPKGAEDFVFDGLAQLDVSWRDQRERPGSRSNRAVSALNSRLPSSLTSSNSPFENRYSR